MNTKATVMKNYTAPLQPSDSARNSPYTLLLRRLATIFIMLCLGCEGYAQMTVQLTPAWNAWAYNVSNYGGADGSIASSVTGGTTPFSYVWTKGSDTIGFTQNVNGLTTGLYQLIVEDSLGLRDTASVYLSQPSVLSASITPHDPCGLASNSATAYPTGAVGPYTYAWDTGDSVATANGLSAGIHEVLITAANGDTVTAHCTIHTPLELEMSATANSYGNHLACEGDTATLDLTVSGGVPPYTYLWESGSFSQDLQATTGGLKKVRVWDSRGCMADDSLLLVAASALNMEVQPHVYPNGQGFSCDTCNDGMFVVMNMEGGEPPYTIAWSTGATGDTLFNMLPDTFYSITITDAQGCEWSDGGAMPRGSLQNSNALNLVVDAPHWAGGYHVSCSTCSDAKVLLYPSGGQPPYAILWADGDTSRYRYNMAAGDYTVKITDQVGDSLVRNVTLIGPSGALAVSLIAKTGGCGQWWYQNIYTYVNGGTPPYSYRWALGDSLFDTTYQFSYLNAPDSGMYTVIVIDANADTVSAQYAGVSAPSEITTTLSAPLIQGNYHATCYGDTVQISLDVIGDNGPFNYTWEHGSFQQNPLVTESMWYKVRVMGMYGCGKIDSIQINIPSEIQPNIAPQLYPDGQAFSCDTCNDGVLALDTIIGGVSPYTILWSDGSTGNTMTNIYADSAIGVVITDALGCVFNISGSLPRGDLSQQGDGTNIEKSNYAGGYNVSCFGCMDGWVQIHAYGGQPPYTFLWADGDTSRYRTGMGAGTYSITVTEGGGHSGTREVVLIGPSNGLDAQISNMTTVNNGLITGGLNAMVNGGVPPYSYVWKQDGSALTNTWSYLSVSQTGTYSLVVTDATSGMDSATVVISLQEDTTTQAPAPPAWGMYGNAGNGDILEGEGTPWFGTADSTDVVMKAYGVPQLRLGANGVTSVEGQLRLAQLQEASYNAAGPQFKLMVADENGVLAKAGGDLPHYFPIQPEPCKYALGGYLPYWDNGVNRIFVDDCYGQVNVGIGTEHPQSRLHVVGNTLNTGNIRSTTLSINTDDVLAQITVKGGTSQSGMALEVQNTDGLPALQVFNTGIVRIRTGEWNLEGNRATLELGDFNQTISGVHSKGLSFSTWDAADALVIEAGGQVNIGGRYSGTAAELWNYQLSVNGKVLGTEFYVTEDFWDTNPWPDFVFKDDYSLLPLEDLQRYIDVEGHLPEVPSAEEVEAEGVGMARMDALLLQKVEELTLYLLEMDKRMKRLEEENTQLKSKNEALKISGK